LLHKVKINYFLFQLMPLQNLNQASAKSEFRNGFAHRVGVEMSLAKLFLTFSNYHIGVQIYNKNLKKSNLILLPNIFF